MDNRVVFVIVPAYNEERMIRFTVQPLLEANYTVVVVDDGSRDNTSAALEGLPVYVLKHLVNLGQGAALQTGMTFALRQGAEFIVHFDADGQHRVEDIDTLLEPLYRKEADVVLGSRFLRKADSQAIPFMRRLLLRGAVIVDGILTGMWLSDAHNGLRALTYQAAIQIHLRENRFAHASEILSQIRQRGLRYVERPTTIAYPEYARAKGQSAWNALNIVADLLLRRLFG